MLVQLRDFPDDLAQKLKRMTHNATASGAVLEVCSGYDGKVQRIASLEHQLAEALEQIAVYQQTLAAARDAAITLAELASQGDLFQPAEKTPARLRHLNR